MKCFLVIKCVNSETGEQKLHVFIALLHVHLLTSSVYSCSITAVWVLVGQLLKLHQLCMVLLICPLQIFHILHHNLSGFVHTFLLFDNKTASIRPQGQELSIHSQQRVKQAVNYVLTLSCKVTCQTFFSQYTKFNIRYSFILFYFFTNNTTRHRHFF